MQDRVDMYYVANLVRMSTFTGAFILVEGPDDKRVYESFFNAQSARVLSGGNKPNVVGAIGILDAGLAKGVVAIIDADFDRIRPGKYNSKNIFITDTHDLETMIYKSQALDRIFGEYGSMLKLKKTKVDLRKVLMVLSIPFGILRLISCTSNLSKVNIEELSLDSIVDLKLFSINESQLLLNYIAVNKIKKNKASLIRKEYGKYKTILQRSQEWDFCRGHDMSLLFAFLLKFKLGKYKSKRKINKLTGEILSEGISSEILESAVRLAFNYNDFMNTNLFQELKQWELQNGGYKLLK